MKFIINCADDEVLSMKVEAGENLVAAAGRQGVSLPVDCLEGMCGTCKMRVVSGRVDAGFYTDDALSPEEVEAGYIVACQATAQSDIVVTTSALSSQLRRAESRTYSGTVTAIEMVAKDTAHLALRLNETDDFDFLPGQYAKLNVPGTDLWRSYSFTTVPGGREPGFLIRVLPEGAMSDYLKSARVGDVLKMSGPHGIFFLRPDPGQAVLVAGGTGLGPMLSMVKTLAGQKDNVAPVSLLYGVNQAAEVAGLDVLGSLTDTLPGFTYAVTVAHADEPSPYARGMVTELLEELDPAQINAAMFYLCGPPVMIEAARTRLKAMGVNEARITYEKFLPSQPSAA